MNQRSEQAAAAADRSRERSRKFILRHERAILCLWVGLLLCLLLLTAEVLLRMTTPYRIDYYTGTFVSRRLIRYPFGDMPFNANGYPDRDWEAPDARVHVAFWGDSITSGVGAGFGHRYTDLIRAARPEHYYMNFGGPGEDGIADEPALEKILELTRRFRLNKVVYAMDLNDILPDRGAPQARHSALYALKRSVAPYLDFLRTRSYLYNYLRMRLTATAAQLGYGYHGDESYELHPQRNAAVIGQTVARINRLALRLRQLDTALCVVIFPYEMQVSADAAARYRRDGIHWSGEFLQGEPQGMIRAALAPDIVTVDLTAAFAQAAGGPARIKVGQYFVFNQGDALDWIHPNRSGHELIAQYLLKSAVSCL